MFNENDVNSELMSVFSNIILQFRKERFLSQEQAADICQIPLELWINLENSSVWPEKNTMSKICRKLYFSQKDFLTDLFNLLITLSLNIKNINQNLALLKIRAARYRISSFVLSKVLFIIGGWFAWFTVTRE